MRLVRLRMWFSVMLVLAGALVVRAVADDKSAQASKPADSQVSPQKSNKSDKKPTAAEKAPGKKPAATEAAKNDAEPVPPKREAAALKFAQQHHPELAELLGRLKVSHPDQYTKALRELDRTRDRLEKAKETDADRYAILLREWQLDSRVRLLAARLTMSTSEELEKELRQALTERHDARLQLLTYDRERSKTRLQKMDEQIAEHVQNRETSIDREFDRLKKSAEMRKKSVTKPAAKRSGDKDK
ncbi:MAG: hypothetical protein FD138_3762 [Planctomycetota bacterium]|nr:MAG: hypothetical protein FD138_3762 [Planctomycetota bacterium]